MPRGQYPRKRKNAAVKSEISVAEKDERRELFDAIKMLNAQGFLKTDEAWAMMHKVFK